MNLRKFIVLYPVWNNYFPIHIILIKKILKHIVSSCIDSCIYSIWTRTFTNGQNSLWKYETPSTWYVNSSTIKLVLTQVNISQTLEKTRTGTGGGFVVSIRTLSDRVVKKLYKSSLIWKRLFQSNKTIKRWHFKFTNQSLPKHLFLLY